MIGTLDAFVLARAKLRSKKVLLVVTVFLASLMFGIVIVAITVITGVSNSAEAYLKSSLGNRYLVEVNPVVPDTVSGVIARNTVPSPTLKATLLALQSQYITQQTALAKQYDVTFDSTSVAPIIQPDPFGVKDSLGQVQQVINTGSPVWQLYVKQLQQQWVKTAPNTLYNLKTTAGRYGATSYYQNQYASLSYLNAQYLAHGQENLSMYGQPPADYNAANPAVTSVRNSGYVFTDQSFVQRFILPENAKRAANKSAIPVVITTQEAVALFGQQLGIGKEPSSAAGQISWMRTLQDKVNGQSYQVCYRSAGQLALIQQVMQQNTAAESASGNYVTPALTYNLPATTCGDVTVKNDTRTVDQKQSDTDEEAFQRAAGIYLPVSSQLLTFQIVGVMSVNPTNGSYTDLPSFINGLLGVNYLYGAFIPNQLYAQLPSSDQYKDILQASVNSVYNATVLVGAGVRETIVAFPSAEKAQAFINANTCYTQDTGNCTKPWTSQIYGSNYLLINSFAKIISNTTRIALPITLAIAVVIIWITMARVIIDSRHETAVFRALGAKRSDIARIYVGYSLIVACFITVIALVMGGVGSGVIELLYGDQATSYAKVAYGMFDQLRPFTFIGVDVTLIVSTIAIIIIISLLAVLPPLIRNVRRNPIRDMRDE